MASVDDVAAAFLADLGPMTTMKLQKLCYYAQAWSLACDGVPLFDEPIEAWRHGPVVRSVWSRYAGRRVVDTWPSGDDARLDARDRRCVKRTGREYGRLDGDELSTLSHLEGPWNTTRVGLAPGANSTRPIRHAVMADYYRRQDTPAEEMIAHVIGSAALEGVQFGDDYEHTLRAVADGELSADDAIAQITRRHSLA